MGKKVTKKKAVKKSSKAGKALDKEWKKTEYGTVKGPYEQKSVIKRIEALFLDNVGKTLTREQIIEAAKDPKTGREPENWHQRLSELRTDYGYTIHSRRNRGDLKVQEYLMPHTRRRPTAGKRVKPTRKTWEAVLERCDNACEWSEDGQRCGLRQGDIDPVSGGRVKLTPDHKLPHSVNPKADPDKPSQWQALCGRHQVMKKNFWDSLTGKLNTYAVVQAAPDSEKREVFLFLLQYFGYNLKDKTIVRKGKERE
jgi:hypothetical protein